MKRSVPAVSPDAYVAELAGWRRGCVEELRAAVRAATLELREGERIAPKTVRELTSAACRLNATLGDPTRLAR